MKLSVKIFRENNLIALLLGESEVNGSVWFGNAERQILVVFNNRNRPVAKTPAGDLFTRRLITGDH